MSTEISKHHHEQRSPHQYHKKQHQNSNQKEKEIEDSPATQMNNKKVSQELGTNVNYISVGMDRFKELTVPVINLLNSLSQSQRRMALLAVGIIFFWPLVLLALNLPWMLVTCASIYGFYFGTGKLYSDANEAVKDHLSVDLEAKGRAFQLKFQESQFPGKEALISSYHVAKDLLKVAYKSVLLASMTVLDYLVTLLLNLARSAKTMAANESPMN